LPEPVEKELNALGGQEGDESLQESGLSTDAVGVNKSFCDVEIEHWDFYEEGDHSRVDDDTRNGLILSVEVMSKQNDGAFAHTCVRLQDADGYEHVPNAESKLIRDMDSEDLLRSPWRYDRIGQVPLPRMGNRIKILLHIQCQSPLNVTGLVVSGGEDTVEIQVGEREWADLRGLPEHLDAGLQSMGMRQA
jgi:hypothetical protein